MSTSTGLRNNNAYLQPLTPIIGKPFILLPLYIYPAPGAWDPLYSAADAYPELEFWVVVNPANGPGAGALPDANYVDALVRLTALHNVKVIGYVHCSYGKRLAEEIVADVEAYGRWEGEMSATPEEGKDIVVDGIFIDETPSSNEFVEYLATLANAAKTILNRNVLAPVSQLEDEGNASRTKTDAATITAEATPPKDGDDDEDDITPPPPPQPLLPGVLTPTTSSAVVIYNPGVVVDPIFYQAADYVVAFENAARHWTNPAVRQGFSRLPRPLVSRSVAVAHSAAGGLVEVGQVSRRAADTGCLGVFVTSKPGYTEWCPVWDEFVGEMARRTLI